MPIVRSDRGHFSGFLASRLSNVSNLFDVKDKASHRVSSSSRKPHLRTVRSPDTPMFDTVYIVQIFAIWTGIRKRATKTPSEIHASGIEAEDDGFYFDRSNSTARFWSRRPVNLISYLSTDIWLVVVGVGRITQRRHKKSAAHDRSAAPATEPTCLRLNFPFRKYRPKKSLIGTYYETGNLPTTESPVITADPIVRLTPPIFFEPIPSPHSPCYRLHSHVPPQNESRRHRIVPWGQATLSPTSLPSIRSVDWQSKTE